MDVTGERDEKASRGRLTASLPMPAVITVLVVVAGLAVTAVLALVTATVNDRNESRLLAVQVEQAATALSGSLQVFETPLASGAAIAGSGSGNSGFDRFMSNFVGPAGPFAYAAQCGTTNGTPVIVGSVGAPGRSPGTQGSMPCDFLSDPAIKPGLSAGRILDGGTRVGLAYRSPIATEAAGVYAEFQLPPHRMVSIPSSAGFQNLDFALFLGRSQKHSDLLETTSRQLPFSGRTASTVVPFANSKLTLVGTPTQPLGGSLSRDLTFFVILFGVLLTIGATVMTERLARRRRSAEGLAEENRRLYAEQQTLAGALQTALLPKLMPEIPGVEVANLYVAGLEVMEIGGDWFDLIAIPDGGFIFVVGDVSGRGVEAAMVMASLHYAIRAYAAEGDSPDVILTKLCTLLDVGRDGHFATVLCGHVDNETHQLTLASAGHFPPLLVSHDGADFMDLDVGPPIGTVEGAAYSVKTAQLPPECTLVAFTDGLVERRDRVIDAGLAKLEETASSNGHPLGQLLSELVAELTPEGSDDDIAILGLRWKNSETVILRPRRSRERWIRPASSPSSSRESSISEVSED